MRRPRLAHPRPPRGAAEPPGPPPRPRTTGRPRGAGPDWGHRPGGPRRRPSISCVHPPRPVTRHASHRPHDHGALTRVGRDAPEAPAATPRRRDAPSTTAGARPRGRWLLRHRPAVPAASSVRLAVAVSSASCAAARWASRSASSTSWSASTQRQTRPRRAASVPSSTSPKSIERGRALPTHDPARRHIDPPPGWMPTSRKRHVEARPRGADGEVAGQHHVDARPHRGAVDGGHRRHGSLVEDPEGPVGLFERHLGLEEIVHRAAGAEHRRSVAQHERPTPCRRGLLHRLDQCLHQVPRQGVATGGVVEHHGRDTVGFLHPDERVRPAHRDPASGSGSNGGRPIWSRTVTTGGLVRLRRCQLAPSTTSTCPEMKRA